MAAAASADTIDLRHSLDMDLPHIEDASVVVILHHLNGAVGEKEHYLLHPSQLNQLPDLEHLLTTAAPEHGKWVSVSPEYFSAIGLLDDDDNDDDGSVLVKRNGPNLGIFALDKDGSSSGNDDPGDDDQGTGAGQGNGNGNGNGSGSITSGPVDVPDGGPTAILLGLSFLAVGMLRRKSSNS